MGDWIPMGRLIFDILFESKLVKNLIDAGITKEVDFVIGKHFSGHTLKNMSVIKHVVNPSTLLDRTFFGSTSMSVDDCNVECLAKGHPQEVLVYKELPKTHEDVYSLKRKRKHISSGEGPSKSVKTTTKVARTFELSILKDTTRP